MGVLRRKIINLRKTRMALGKTSKRDSSNSNSEQRPTIFRYRRRMTSLEELWISLRISEMRCKT